MRPVTTYTTNTYRGKYTPQNPQKYRGDIHNIFYRSSWEFYFMRWCDLRSSVLEWGSEEVIVPYINPFDHEQHRYFVDFYVKVKTSTGTKKYWVEVKPFRFTQEPTPQKRKTKQFINEVIQWGVNKAKWDAASKYAARCGVEFLLLTENELGLNPFKKKKGTP